MASISDILLAQGQQAAAARRSRGGVWTPLVRSIANLPNQISADREASRQAGIAEREAEETRQLRGLQRQEVEGRLTDAESARTGARQEQEVRAALLDVLSQPDIVNDEGFDLPKARQYADSKGWGQLLSGALIEADRETDAAAIDAQTKRATLGRITREGLQAEADARQATNQQGVRRMIGERVATGEPLAEPERQTLRGMAFQEGVALPEGFIDEKPDTRALNVQLADAIKRGDMRTASAIRQAIRQSAADGRAPAPAEDPLARRERELRIAKLEMDLQQAQAPGGNVSEKLEAVAPVLDEIVDLSKKIFTSDAGPWTNIVGAWKAAGAASNLNNDVREYRSLVRGFMPLMARAVGHNGVLTEQDVERTEMLFPAIGIFGTDNTTVADNKLERMKRIMVGGGTDAEKAEIRRMMGWDQPRPGAAPPGRGAGPATPIIVDGFEVIAN